MGKKRRNRDKSKSPDEAASSQNKNDDDNSDDDDVDAPRARDDRNNPLYTQQDAFLQSLSPTERDYFFSETHVTPDRRAELWMQQADLGEDMVNRYAWATPSENCIKIFQAFSPIIEMGCGRNAYWANVMMTQSAGENGIDVVAYDSNVQAGGVIDGTGKGKKKKKKKKDKQKDEESPAAAVVTRQGGPEVLELPENRQRTLFLCYPDEEDAEPQESDDDGDRPPLSFGWQCLENYQGQYVIHVGELAFLDTNLSMDQAPWGRSSSLEFQQRLASEFHCLLKIQLPNWLHVRDSISVWKRSEICPIVFAADEDDSDDEEEVIAYRHIPPDELLPKNIAAPCLAHLLPATATPTAKQKEKRKRTDSHDSAAFSHDGTSGHKKRKKKKKKNTSNETPKGSEGDYSSPW